MAKRKKHCNGAAWRAALAWHLAAEWRHAAIERNNQWPVISNVSKCEMEMLAKWDRRLNIWRYAARNERKRKEKRKKALKMKAEKLQ